MMSFSPMQYKTSMQHLVGLGTQYTSTILATQQAAVLPRSNPAGFRSTKDEFHSEFKRASDAPIFSPIGYELSELRGILQNIPPHLEQNSSAHPMLQFLAQSDAN